MQSQFKIGLESDWRGGNVAHEKEKRDELNVIKDVLIL